MCQNMLTEQHRVQITERHKKTSFKKKEMYIELRHQLLTLVGGICSKVSIFK